MWEQWGHLVFSALMIGLCGMGVWWLAGLFARFNRLLVDDALQLRSDRSVTRYPAEPPDAPDAVSLAERMKCFWEANPDDTYLASMIVHHGVADTLIENYPGDTRFEIGKFLWEQGF